MSRTALAALAAASAALSLLIGPAAVPAQATLPSQSSASPQVALTVPVARIDANTDFAMSSSSSSLGRGTTVYLQRQVGTSHKYQNVTTAPKSGSFNVAGVPMGKYVYRLVAVRNGVTIATSSARAVYSYGNLTAAQLCARTEHTQFDDCESGTIPVGDKVFSYTNIDTHGNSGPDGYANVMAQHSSCRSASLQYAVTNNSADYGATGVGAALSQESMDRQLSSGGVRVVSSGTFAIKSAAWNLEFWAEGSDSYGVYWRGTFSCYTTNGDR